MWGLLRCFARECASKQKRQLGEEGALCLRSPPGSSELVHTQKGPQCTAEADTAGLGMEAGHSADQVSGNTACS